eukprot:scaffold1306_cov98-Skeletonema_dohrnii-CCMP3373.AAC.8
MHARMLEVQDRACCKCKIWLYAGYNRQICTIGIHPGNRIQLIGTLANVARHIDATERKGQLER